jgi:hypothetical protein
MKTFRIEGNHPIARYITWSANGLDELNRKVKELEDHGYEVTVEPLEESTTEAISQRLCK